ncbi:PRDX3 protein, partial [Polypterus senegalus]
MRTCSLPVYPRTELESPQLRSLVLVGPVAAAPFTIGCSRWAPAVTQHAPFFKGTAVVHGEFKEISLDDYKSKYLVLFFYPLDFTFVCPTEIIAFSEKAKEFRDVNCEVVGVSVDSHFTHLAWINTPRKSGGLGSMNIPLLSDLNKTISRDYGVLLEGPGIALRGLFIIDPNGVVKHISINDLPVGRCVDETLRLLKAFQFVETHGEVCPANWTPHSPTFCGNTACRAATEVLYLGLPGPRNTCSPMTAENPANNGAVTKPSNDDRWECLGCRRSFTDIDIALCVGGPP